jgi:pimeloyl-ACP methyl ester carboxylesterase
MGDDVVAVLDCGLIDPEQVVHGVGHSMGGATLVLAAAQRPGRIRSLWLYEPVLVPPGALPAETDPNPMADAATRRRTTFPSFSEAIAHYGAKAPLNQLRPDALEAYVMGGFALGRDGSVHLECEPLTEAQVFRGAVDSGAFEVLSKLDVPAAIVTGRAETFGPASFVSAIVDQWPSAVLDEQRHLGHFGPLEDPTAMAHDLDAWVRTHA